MWPLSLLWSRFWDWLQGKQERATVVLGDIYDFKFQPPSLRLQDSLGWLIMEQSSSLIIYICHMSRPPPYLHPNVNHLHHSNWSTRSLWPLALLCQCQLWIHCLSRESEDKAERALLRSPLPSPWSLTSSCLAWLPRLRMFTLNWAAHSSPGPRGTPLCHFQWLT